MAATCNWPVRVAPLNPPVECGARALQSVERRILHPDGRRGPWVTRHVCGRHLEVLAQAELIGGIEVRQP